MQDFEKLGQFYLGRRYNLQAGRLEEDLIMYDSKDLVTHGVCVGMTGSGKTGLCIALLEEAAIDSIPALVIDPKGDMANLLLAFPGLSASEFLPWIDADAASRADQSREQYAAAQAEAWKKGLELWGQDGRRISRLRESADFRIYTPGSTAGVPLSVLNSFARPAAAVLEDREVVVDLISSAVTSLLGLIGIAGDPISSREHILISNIVQHCWTQGTDVDMAGLIHSIQTPPMDRVGAFAVDSFFPAKERFELSLKLNNLLAAPGFSAWLEGDPLDIGRFLHTAEGRPRVSIFSIAHLTDSERMFFVTLLLNQLVAWMRTQAGTDSLRALVYMDEVSGYLPPVAVPPSKKPLMLLFKQARAFGVGVLIATQNPVDLDYKALSNAGTWFIGRLQTPQDVDRLIGGLNAGATESGDDLRKTVLALGKRVFLMKNIHENAPEIFQTRWCLSYLRGPLTPAQVKSLSLDTKAEPRAVPGMVARSTAAFSDAASVTDRPSLPPQVPEFFLEFRAAKPEGATLLYRPMVCAMADIYCGGQNQRQVFLTDVGKEMISLNWDESRPGEFDEALMGKAPAAEASEFEPPAAAAFTPENYKVWSRDFAAFLCRTAQIHLYRNAQFKLTSNPEESESDFRIRVSHMAREKRDRSTEVLRGKYGPQIALLQERIRRAEQRVEKEKADVRQAGVQTAISLGATLLGAFIGRKTLSAGTIGRAATTMRSGSRTAKERSDVAAASENLDALLQQKADLESEFNLEIKALELSGDPLQQEIETVTQHPKKTDITVRMIGLIWLPYWRTPGGPVRPA